jgi:fused signal recognition particle receptor
MTEPSWHDKLLGGFRRTSDRLGDNLTGLFTRAHSTVKRSTRSRRR